LIETFNWNSGKAERWNIGFNILKKPVFQHSITSEIPKMEGHQKVNSCGQGRGR